ncbi:hypothetical protein QUF64_16730 [Anaerolineales bacterium HSG6]|nr:hypothetical protein [Anaerolineales bacterium HSG6]
MSTITQGSLLQKIIRILQQLSESQLLVIFEFARFLLSKEQIPKTETLSVNDRINVALQEAGIKPYQPEEVAQYLASPENQNWQPLLAGGKPASELIIEERRT